MQLLFCMTEIETVLWGGGERKTKGELAVYSSGGRKMMSYILAPLRWIKLDAIGSPHGKWRQDANVFFIIMELKHSPAFLFCPVHIYLLSPAFNGHHICIDKWQGWGDVLTGKETVPNVESRGVCISLHLACSFCLLNAVDWSIIAIQADKWQ